MSSNVYSTDIVAAIRSVLDADEWKYTFDKAEGVIKFGLKLNTKMKHIDYVIRIKDDNYTVYAVSPISADEDDGDMMVRMADFICRANYGLRNGNFEFDFRDGEIRYKSHVNCEDRIPCEQVVRNSINIPHSMFKRYSPGILDIIFNEATAEAAVSACEKASEDIDELLRRLSDSLGLSSEDSSKPTN